MPVLTGTIRNGAGAGFAAELTFARIGEVGLSGGDAYGADTLSATAASNGTFTITLSGGTWRMRWYRASRASELVLGMPSTGGPYDLEDVAIDAADPYPDTSVQWFNDIQDMLTADSTAWSQGRTLNSYGTDGIRSGWDRVLLSDPAAASLTANSDSILATQDGFALCVRTFISG